MPRPAICAGVMPLMPRSTAATVKRRSPTAGTIRASGVETSPHRSAPAITGCSSTLARSLSGFSSRVEIPTRIAPRERMWRVRARVSMSQIPTIPWFASSASRLLRLRQFDGRGAGSRTT